MRYTVRKSLIRILGKLWMPSHADAATEMVLGKYELDNCRDDEGELTRESVERWLLLHSGDFSDVIDFEASLEDGGKTIDIAWKNEESEWRYADCFSDTIC